MSLLAMPWVVLNLGSEMVYILEQRLRAQNVPWDKSCRVLHDVARTLFDRSFVSDKLFVAQPMYSPASTRKIFARLAHSSIMRLSEASMDKLFDLMVMGAKYQLLCCTRLQELMQVVLQHLAGVKAILVAFTTPDQKQQGQPPAVGLIEHAEACTSRMYSALGYAELAQLRQALLRFFQGKRVKVSIFLAEGIQAPNGRIVLPSPLHEHVGAARSFDANGALEHEELLKLACQQVDPSEFFCHPVVLGGNLYTKARPKVTPPPRTSQQGRQPPETEPSAPGPAGSSKAPKVASSHQRARQELDLLAALVGAGSQPPGGPSDFKLSLFDCDEDEGSSAWDPAAAAAEEAAAAAAAAPPEAGPLQFGSSAARNEAYMQASGLGDVLAGLDLGEGCSSIPAPGDELLALMDSVA